MHRSAEKSRYKQINKAVYVLAFPLPGKWLSDIKSWVVTHLSYTSTQTPPESRCKKTP